MAYGNMGKPPPTTPHPPVLIQAPGGLGDESVQSTMGSGGDYHGQC
jgi:hypothetical protein